MSGDARKTRPMPGWMALREHAGATRYQCLGELFGVDETIMFMPAAVEDSVCRERGRSGNPCGCAAAELLGERKSPTQDEPHQDHPSKGRG